MIPGSVVAPQGFQAAGVHCDIKRLGTGKGSNRGPKRDLALILSDRPARVAGLFTTNQICAAPVKVCLERVRGEGLRGIVANSGNANACTGEKGLQDALSMTVLAEKATGCPPGSFLVCSTGRIGVHLPLPNVKKGIQACAKILESHEDSAAHAAEAIMTSDSRSKQIAVEYREGNRTIRIGGIAKGAGMIEPGMSPTGQRPPSRALHATMLSFITTDAAVDPAVLDACLEKAVAASFNRITVDGDMSTNDTVLLLANGAAGAPEIKKGSRAAKERFQIALNHVALELAKMIVLDGEGVSRFITVHVEGARNDAEADLAARAVANSALVKTSWFGGDPNWGRIMDALGYSAAKVVEDKVDISYAEQGSAKHLDALKAGRPTRVKHEALRAISTQPAFDLHIHLNLGRGSAIIYTSDLTEEYVDFNKGE